MSEPRIWPQSAEDEYQKFMAFDPDVLAWRRAFFSKFGEYPNTESVGDFNYRTAFAAGDRPRQIAGDTVPHWGSVGKSNNHPTAWKQHFVERFGVDPDTGFGAVRMTPEMLKMILENAGEQSVVAPFALPNFGSSGGLPSAIWRK